MWGTRSWNESHKNGNALCECGDVYSEHKPEDEGGWCEAMHGDKHCDCQGFRVKKEDGSSTASAEQNQEA